MRGWKIRKQIMLITMSCFVLSILLISFDLIKEKRDDSNNINVLESNIREDYDNNLKNQVTTALSLIDALRKQYESENISEEIIKYKIAGIIRNLRYGDSGYFWVDTSDGTNVVLYGSDTEGTNRFNFQDIKGKYVVQEVIEKAKAGGGFTDYYFPKEGEKDPKPKRAYGLYYEKFDWIIGTGLYTDAIDEVIDTKITEQNKVLWEHIM